ncbi:MAG TPA: DUF2203 domain-containing protein [Pyrinomonadaceae bacterium]|nr:DUF2203 domain-containing protein [Pyrinomonadaceae bacterium]
MKLFSVEEANALLPAVRAILLRIRRSSRRLLAYQPEARRASDAAEHGGGGMRSGSEYVSLLMEILSSAGELETLGVQLKDQERGLIDFPSLRDGRVVLLCWHLGEGDQIEWWHDVEAGFAGRQPL